MNRTTAIIIVTALLLAAILGILLGQAAGATPLPDSVSIALLPHHVALHQ